MGSVEQQVKIAKPTVLTRVPDDLRVSTGEDRSRLMHGLQHAQDASLESARFKESSRCLESTQTGVFWRSMEARRNESRVFGRMDLLEQERRRLHKAPCG